MSELSSTEDAIYSLQGVLADYEHGESLGEAGHNSVGRAIAEIQSLQAERSVYREALRDLYENCEAGAKFLDKAEKALGGQDE